MHGTFRRNLRGEIDGTQKDFSFDFHAVSGIFRNDLLVLRIIAFDDLGNDFHLVAKTVFGLFVHVDFKAHLTFIEPDAHLAFVSELLLKLVHRFRGKNERFDLIRNGSDFAFACCETPSVRRDERQSILGKAEENAVENVAVFVGGLGVRHAANHRRKLALVDFEKVFAADDGKRRELFRLDSGHQRFGAPASDFDSRSGEKFEADFIAHHSRSDVFESPRGQSDASGNGDVRLDETKNADVEVRRRQPNFVSFRLNEHVAENGKRGTAVVHDVHDLAESRIQKTSVNAEFHKNIASPIPFL